MRKKIIEYFSKKIFKPQKTTGTEVVNPFERKKMRSNRDAVMGGLKVDLAKLKGGAKKLQTSVEDVKAAMRDRARVKKMGGGFMGKRMGYSRGNPKPKTNVQKIKETFAPKKKLSPKQMKIAKLAGDPKKIDAKDLAKLRGRG